MENKSGPVVLMKNLSDYLEIRDSEQIAVGDKMIVELNDETCTLLQKIKKEFDQPLSDSEVIKDALVCYHSDIAQINTQKRKYDNMV